MILKMKRITLIAHKSDETAILQALQSTGAVEVIAGDEPRAENVGLSAAEETVQKLSSALTLMRPYAKKRGMLSPDPEGTLAQIQETVPSALQVSDSLTKTAHALSHAKSEIEKNEGVMESLRPWLEFPADVARFQSSKNVQYFTGMLAERDTARLDELGESAEYQFFNEGVLRATLIACAKSEAKSVSAFIKSLDWTDYVFPKLSGTPREITTRLSSENEVLHAHADELEDELAQRAGESGEALGQALDAAVIDQDRMEAAAELTDSSATFMLEGWTPEERLADVEKAVLRVTDAYYLDSRDPAEDETPPSVVRNDAFVEPFEAVVNLYSRPDPRGIDAAPYMAPFYVLLFGLMLSDTGYGLVLSLLCLLYIKLKKPTGMTGGFARVLFWGGLSTMVWGVLVGTFFGLDFDVIFGTVNRFPLLVDPMDEPIMMLILCFGLGLLHILFGMGIKMKMAFQRGDWQTAIFDNLSWMFIIFGLLGLVYEPTKKAGMILAIVGALMILLFKGRASKNIFKRTVSGLGELYQITSFLSDVLSYARLFALGIATGVIASVFNDLCGMLMGSPNIILKILGVLVAIVLLIALHAFNIGINTLGAFVHCARLQYVEFFGKFYEPGGREFKPLGYRTKHIRLINEAS